MNLANRHRAFLICALLSAITFAAYWPVLNNGFINLDDYRFVTKNPNVASGLTWTNVKWSFQCLYDGNWHPLTWLSHMLDVQWFGLNPRGHHLVSLLLHLANTLLLFGVMWRMMRLRSEAPSSQAGMAWRSAFVAALFAVHPLHVESVAWVAERKDVLSTLFFLLTLWAYARYAQRVTGDKWQVASGKQVTGTEATAVAPDSSPATRHPSLFYGLALLFFILGLMCKPMLVTLPFVLLLLDYWPLGRVRPALHSLRAEEGSAELKTGDQLPGATKRSEGGSTIPQLLFEKLPFFAVSIAFCWVTFVTQRLEGAFGLNEHVSLDYRLANAALSYCQYLGKTFWPAKLVMFYPYTIGTGFLDDVKVWLAAALLAAVSFMALRWLRRFPWFATGWFWFLGTLVPVIGIVQVGGQAMADRYTYIPLIGVFVCLVWAAAESSAAGRFRVKVPALVGAALIIACVAVTRQQVRYWRDNFTIARHALDVMPNNPCALTLLGDALVDEGKFDQAAEQFRAALAADPEYPLARYNLTVALKRSAKAMIEQGRFDEAVARYESLLEIEPAAPTFNDLGYLLWHIGRPREAVEQYQAALRLQPDYADARCNLAAAFASDGKLDEARAQYAEAVRLNPKQLEARLGLGRILALQDRLTEAEANFREAARLYPANAQANLELGVNLMMSGQTNEAARFFAAALRSAPDLAAEKKRAGKKLADSGQVDAAASSLQVAVWLQPDDADAHETLGMLRLRQDRSDDAAMQFAEALRLRPDAQSHYDLGMALSFQGRTREAIAHYETAIQLKPDWPEALNGFAWILATAPDAQWRNGARAAALAEQACRLTDFKEPLYVGTLAAAYAEAGRFAEAVQTAEKTIALASAQNNQELARQNRELLEFYRAGETVLQGRSRAGK